MANVRSVCVMCGSRLGNEPAYRAAAVELGTILARRGVRLVYGGGSVGLMGAVADAAMAAGGEVIGIIPDFLMKLEVGHNNLSELVITGSMQDRKVRMFEMADAFVVLPGGLGTLDEAFEIITWKQLRLHEAPIVVLDVAGYWAPFGALVDAVIAAGFAHPAVADLYTVVTTAEQVLAAFAAAPVVRDIVLTSHL